MVSILKYFHDLSCREKSSELHNDETDVFVKMSRFRLETANLSSLVWMVGNKFVFLRPEP